MALVKIPPAVLPFSYPVIYSGPGELAISYHCLEYVTDGPVARVTLSRPNTLNRVDCLLATELREVCRAIQEDDGIDLLVLTGSGTAFSVGREPVPPELDQASRQERQAWLDQLRAADAVAELPMPVVVVLNGDAMGHGLELALAGDLRIAVPEARFGLTGLTKGYAFPWDGGTQRLPRLIGPAWASDMILTGRVIDAPQALSLGLINRIVPVGELPGAVDQLADSILAGGPIAVRYAKEAVGKGLDLSLPQGLGLEADLNVLLQNTSDRAEGLRSFREKRPPKFAGR